MTPFARLVVAALVLGAAALGFFWWRQHTQHATAPPAGPMDARAPVTPPPSTPVAQAGPPPIRHPLPSGSPAGAGASPDQSSDAFLRNALIELLGSRSVQSYLVTDDFARRLVATVNNLATNESAVDSWPVRAAGGHFDAEPNAGGTMIASTNSARYAPFVHFVEGVDTQRAVALYQRLYPVLQRAYEDLGFSGRYFNDRLVEVIDNLLATPAASQPIKVKKVQANGTGSAGTSGGLYVFADPSLEAASTGQKILLRMGPENAGRLKVKLADIRLRIATTVH